ncbi:GNAT family N-acetyltransferase [Chungangia koreensis]|uniref:GNAT family N-acetyltransferase n=1 Tax=Chungangia koreensis TaxID=752657 RepID=A0ABV8X752_9LACT
MKITIRKLTSIEDMHLVLQLENIVWMESTPIHQTFTAAKNGGILVGAFTTNEDESEGKLVGFCYGFAGFKEGQAYLCSHMMGIHPDYRSSGIGRRLKEEQRQIAKDIGYDLIIWTFDPLESRNSYLNTSKLFGISDTYIVNCYGEMNDGLNNGLPTDRLQIEWWIRSERVEEQWRPSLSFENPFSVSLSSKGNPMLMGSKDELPFGNSGIEVPIPTDFQNIKKSEPELAYEWRMKIREIYQAIFTEGYTLTGVRKADGPVQFAQFIPRKLIPLKRIERGANQ